MIDLLERFLLDRRVTKKSAFLHALGGTVVALLLTTVVMGDKIDLSPTTELVVDAFAFVIIMTSYFMMFASARLKDSYDDRDT